MLSADMAYRPGKVVLTFDDGPDPDFTPRILDILKKEKVPASFFVVGSMVEKNIPILRVFMMRVMKLVTILISTLIFQPFPLNVLALN
jgi:hypothetical protein